MSAKPANLHELAREALAIARVAFPDPLADVEHRGDGDCVVNGEAIVDLLSRVLREAFAALEDGESLWMRSSGVDPETLAIDVRWRGATPRSGAGLAAGEGMQLTIEADAGEQHVRLEFSRNS
jgi:hypothetical protein